MQDDDNNNSSSNVEDHKPFIHQKFRKPLGWSMRVLLSFLFSKMAQTPGLTCHGHASYVTHQPSMLIFLCLIGALEGAWCKKKQMTLFANSTQSLKVIEKSWKSNHFSTALSFKLVQSICNLTSTQG